MAEANAEKPKPKGKGKAKGKAEKTLEGLQPEKERKLHADGYDWVYGVDEAGRGPLAGPVVTACCYVPPEMDIPGIMVRGRGGGRGCAEMCAVWPVWVQWGEGFCVWGLVGAGQQADGRGGARGGLRPADQHQGRAVRHQRGGQPTHRRDQHPAGDGHMCLHASTHAGRVLEMLRWVPALLTLIW